MAPNRVDALVALTRHLIAIDSQNPKPGEEECARTVAKWLDEAGAKVERVPVAGHPANVVARLAGTGEGPTLVLLGHLDTVPVGSGWTMDPFGGEVREGRIYGRGSADTKGGLAAMLLLARDVLRSGGKLAGDLIIAATVDEEGPDMAGAAALVSHGVIPEGSLTLALEPTNLRLRIAQVGLRWYRVHTFGRMAHAGRAAVGVDANHAMALVVAEIKQAVAGLGLHHPLLGTPVVTASRLDGGFKTNVVPDRCYAEFDLRFVPPMSLHDADVLIRDAVARAVTHVTGARAEVEALGLGRPPVQADDDSPLVVALSQAFQRVTGRPLPRGGDDGHEAYTDASLVAAMTGSRNCTVFGPGSTDIAHTADEYVEIEHLQVASEVLRELVRVTLRATIDDQ